MTTLTIDAKDFRDLVTPVLPMACKDDMYPVLCAVLVESDGKWLSATTTDRFRGAIKRIKKRATDDDPTTEWPKFRALIPMHAVRSLLTMFKVKARTPSATMTLTVEGDDGGVERLTAEAVGLFDLFDSGRFVYTLAAGEFPNIRPLIRQALETPQDERSAEVGLNPNFMADFRSCGAQTLRVILGAPGKVAVVTDDDGFIGLIMPRRLLAGVGEPTEVEDWSAFLADKPEPKTKKASRRKVGAA